MSNKYTSIYVDLQVKKDTQNSQTIITQSARLWSDFIYFDSIIGFLDNLKKVQRLLKKAIKENSYIEITFGRYTSYEENGYTYFANERVATYTGYGCEIEENGGMYLSNHRDNSDDFWLDINTKIEEALKNFADESCFWTENARKIW